MIFIFFRYNSSKTQKKQNGATYSYYFLFLASKKLSKKQILLNDRTLKKKRKFESKERTSTKKKSLPLNAIKKKKKKKMKAYILLGLAVVATIFFVAAVATPFAVDDVGNVTGSVSLWLQCVSSSGKSGCDRLTRDFINCSSLWSLLVAGRAFGVLTILACGVFAIVAAVCAFKPALALLPTVKRVLIGFGVATAIFGLIYFPIDFSLFFSKFCTESSLSNRGGGIKIGASAPLALIGWIMAVVALVMSFIGGGAPPTSGDAVYNAV